MKRAGMQWTLPGAQALLNLRCGALNDDWEPFMNYYIHQETTRLLATARSNHKLPSFASWPDPGVRSTGYARLKEVQKCSILTNTSFT